MITFAPNNIVVEQTVLGALSSDTNDILLRQFGSVLKPSHFAEAIERHLPALESALAKAVETANTAGLMPADDSSGQ